MSGSQLEGPPCHNTEVVKNGKSAAGKQRYRYQNFACLKRISLSPTALRRTRQVKQQIVEMILNGSGVRGMVRVLYVSATSVIEELKKLNYLKPVNHRLLRWLKPKHGNVVRVAEPNKVEIEESELGILMAIIRIKPLTFHKPVSIFLKKGSGVDSWYYINPSFCFNFV